MSSFEQRGRRVSSLEQKGIKGVSSFGEIPSGLVRFKGYYEMSPLNTKWKTGVNSKIL